MNRTKRTRSLRALKVDLGVPIQRYRPNFFLRRPTFGWLQPSCLLTYASRKDFHCCTRVIGRTLTQNLSFGMHVSGGPSLYPPLEAVPVLPRHSVAQLGPLPVLRNLKKMRVRFRAVYPGTLSVGTDRGPRSNPPCARSFPSVFKALQNVVSALLPTATAKADMLQMVMSALPPIATAKRPPGEASATVCRDGRRVSHRAPSPKHPITPIRTVSQSKWLIWKGVALLSGPPPARSAFELSKLFCPKVFPLYFDGTLSVRALSLFMVAAARRQRISSNRVADPLRDEDQTAPFRSGLNERAVRVVARQWYLSSPAKRNAKPKNYFRTRLPSSC
jgi:hypothetical protein